MAYTIQQVSKLAGVSVRTLHYYDQIELLQPAYVGENGYRFYEEKELARLQQILFFRELDFSLEQIKQIMESPSFDSVRALEDQRELLKLKKERTERLIDSIEQTIQAMKGGEVMSNDDKYSAFNDPTYQEHKKEVEERWGHTEAYNQSMERVAKMTKEDMERIKNEGNEIVMAMVKLMRKGVSVESSEVQEQIERHYNSLRNFYDPNPQMYKGLGQMYVADPRFKQFYEKVATGLAEYMRDAMGYFADQQESK